VADDTVVVEDSREEERTAVKEMAVQRRRRKMAKRKGKKKARTVTPQLRQPVKLQPQQLKNLSKINQQNQLLLKRPLRF
jgi:hypothetical protein